MLEVDKTAELIRSLPTQQRLALTACYLGLRNQKRGSFPNSVDEKVRTSVFSA